MDFKLIWIIYEAKSLNGLKIRFGKWKDYKPYNGFKYRPLISILEVWSTGINL